jgi:hypothetical protein
VHTADVKNVLRVYSIEVAAREKDDLNEDPIVTRLRKVRSCIIQFAPCSSRPDCLTFIAFNNRPVGPAMTAFKTDPYYVNAAEWFYVLEIQVIIDRLPLNSAFWINAFYTLQLLENFHAMVTV